MIGSAERRSDPPRQPAIKIRVVSPAAELVLEQVPPAKPQPTQPRPKASNPVVKPKPQPQKVRTEPPSLSTTLPRPSEKTAPPPEPSEAAARATNLQAQKEVVERQIASYSDALRQYILKHRQYPTMARRLKQQGTVEVEFVVYSDGAIGQAKVKRTSGYALIDEASLKLLAKLKSFRPLPGRLASRTFVVPIRYQLR